MTRTELAAILVEMVGRNTLSAADARLTLTRFDAGELTDLPLSAAELAEAQDDDRWLIAVALLALLLRTTPGRTLSASERKRAQGLLDRQYGMRVAQQARSVASGGKIATWQTEIQTTISTHARQMAVAGASGLPRTAVQAEVDSLVSGQWGYLAGFGVALMVGRVVGRPLSEAAIAARSLLYGGVGTGAYWRGVEPTPGYGQIVHYDSRDDDATCGPCSEAERRGPYLVGSAYPRPGEVCLGRGRCHCQLRFEFNPSVYARLTGRGSV